MILKGNFTGYNMKKKLSVKTLMGKVQNFFTPVKHKSRSYLEYCVAYKQHEAQIGLFETRK